jgi:hypothetical protein
MLLFTTTTADFATLYSRSSSCRAYSFSAAILAAKYVPCPPLRNHSSCSYYIQKGMRKKRTFLKRLHYGMLRMACAQNDLVSAYVAGNGVSVTVVRPPVQMAMLDSHLLHFRAGVFEVASVASCVLLNSCSN